MRKYLFVLIVPIALSACQEPSVPLRPLGNTDYIEREEEGQKIVDTIYHTIPDFALTNQDGQAVTPSTFDDKVYVSDFFFTHCPTICPRVKAQMLRIYDKFEENDRFVMASHSLDPKRDSVSVLKDFANKLRIEAPKWQLLTGDKTEIYDLAHEYLVVAAEDADAPGGITHSGHIILVDTKKRIRAYCDGTDPKDVTRLMKDINRLLDEEFGN